MPSVNEQQLPSEPAPDGKPPHDDVADSLKMPARIACGVVSVVTGAAGGIGSFVPDSNGGGIPVLLAIAALFGYLAISGQRITLLKLGDNEARLSRAVRAAGRALSDPEVPESTKAEIAEDLDAIAPTLSAQTRQAVERVLTNRSDALSYELAVKDALESMFPEEYIGEVINNEKRFDALLQSDKASLVVEIKHGRSDRVASMVEDAARQLEWQLATVPSFTAGLLVINRPVSDLLHRLLQQARSQRPLAAVTWRGPEDNEALRAAVNRLLAS